MNVYYFTIKKIHVLKHIYLSVMKDMWKNFDKVHVLEHTF